tara:strand:+ start:2745 stop:3731 length:987 start_codon:yes stop_codon:yes gene_type:complete
MKRYKLSTSFVASLILTLPLAGTAVGNDYPTRDIMHIMPWSAGGGTDTVMRTFMNYAERTLDVGINTQNITGAQSGIGTMRLMRARPDGYTIGTLTWDSVITVPYYNLVPGYDVEQLTYLGAVTVHPTAIIVNANSSWETLEDFVAEASEAPGTLSISNVGAGSVWHLPALDFANQAGIEVQHIPYPTGSGPQMEALLSGETDAASTSISAAYTAIESGQARVLAVMGDEREESFPDVPTFKELGYDVVWGGFRLIATQTAVELAQRQVLESAFAEVFDIPAFQKVAEETGMGAVWMDAKEASAYVQATQERAFALMDELAAQGLLED